MKGGFFANGEDDFKPRTIPPTIDIIEGDAFVELPKMEDASVDVIITDPPYSDKTHNGARTTVGSKSFANGGDPLKLITTFDSITSKQFMEFANQAVRVAKRWVITFCDWRYAHLLEEIGLVRLGCWEKKSCAPQFTGDRPAQGWESIAILHRPGKKQWNGGGKAAVWREGKVNAKWHPTQKPLSLMKELVTLFSNPGETVLDPFAGSGTTLLSCLLCGRKAIGIEKDPEYVKIINKRVARRQ